MGRRLGILLAVLVGLIAFYHPVAAQAPEGLVADITAPIPGQQLFGQIEIRGSAAHPSAFASYTLEYDDLSDPAAQWFLVQERVSQQVDDGVLGIWNTLLLPDGVYQLRLRVFLTDGQTGEFVVSNLRIVNTEPTPLPTAAGGPDGATPSGPTPTPPLIEQPPSNNPPDLSQGAGPGLAPTPVVQAESTAGSSTRINFSRARAAFCSGVYLGLAAFGVMLVYTLLRRWQSSGHLNENR